MQDPRAGGPSVRWAQGAVSRLNGHAAAWGKGIGLDGRGRLPSRGLERERDREVEWVEREGDNPAKSARQHSLPAPLGTDHVPDLYL